MVETLRIFAQSDGRDFQYFDAAPGVQPCGEKPASTSENEVWVLRVARGSAIALAASRSRVELEEYVRRRRFNVTDCTISKLDLGLVGKLLSEPPSAWDQSVYALDLPWRLVKQLVEENLMTAGKILAAGALGLSKLGFTGKQIRMIRYRLSRIGLQLGTIRPRKARVAA
jgi:hypothetical protein